MDRSSMVTNPVCAHLRMVHTLHRWGACCKKKAQIMSEFEDAPPACSQAHSNYVDCDASISSMTSHDRDVATYSPSSTPSHKITASMAGRATGSRLRHATHTSHQTTPSTPTRPQHNFNGTRSQQSDSEHINGRTRTARMQDQHKHCRAPINVARSGNRVRSASGQARAPINVVGRVEVAFRGVSPEAVWCQGLCSWALIILKRRTAGNPGHGAFPWGLQ